MLQRFDQGEYLFALPQRLVGYLPEMVEQIRFLDNDGLIEAKRITDEMGKGIWFYHASLLSEARDRIPYGNREEILDKIASDMGFSIRWARALIGALEACRLREEPNSPPLAGPTFYQLALKSSSPGDAVGLLEDRKAENPNYPLSAFREDLGMDKDRKRKNVECPECGHEFEV